MQKHQHNKTHYIKKEEEEKKRKRKKEGLQASAWNISFSPNHSVQKGKQAKQVLLTSAAVK